MPTQISLSQAAILLNVSEKSIRRYIKSGKIKASLVKGERGYEYTINKDQLKGFNKPLRGKNSHRVAKKVKVASVKKPTTVPKKRFVFEKEVATSPVIAPKIDSVSDILEQKIKNNQDHLSLDKNSIDYKLLYERLLVKYEQALMMIGSLEAQQGSNYPPKNNERVARLEEDLAKQEELILGLYQDLQLYKENNY